MPGPVSPDPIPVRYALPTGKQSPRTPSAGCSAPTAAHWPEMIHSIPLRVRPPGLSSGLVSCASGYQDRQGGIGGAYPGTSCRGQRTEAGR